MPKYWFKPKTIGYGATPSTWQGWVLTFAAVGLMIGVVKEAMRIPDRQTSLLVAISGAAIILIAFSWVAYIKTDGEWRWRSGRD
jgi:hypothetical protein